MISGCIRKLGWDKDIVVTLHGVTQEYVDRTKGKNKFLYICSLLGMRLDGIQMPENVTMPELYWHYEKHSEKMADIQINSGSHSIAQTGAQKSAANPHKEIEYQFALF